MMKAQQQFRKDQNVLLQEISRLYLKHRDSGLNKKEVARLDELKAAHSALYFIVEEKWK